MLLLKKMENRMSNNALRHMIAAVIAMLLIHQVGILVMGIFGMAWGAFSAVVVLVVSFFSARQARAGGKRFFWFFLPTILFIVCPLVFRVWEVMSEDVGWLERTAKIAPFMIGFGLPIVLLLFVYHGLRKRNGEA